MTSYGCSKSKKNSIKETPMAYPTIALSDCRNYESFVCF